jgi:hypothetical protein
MRWCCTRMTATPHARAADPSSILSSAEDW